MAPTLFRLLLIVVVIYALMRGSRDERIVALICAIGALATTLAISPLQERYDGIETTVLIIDIAVLVGFIIVALQSSRFWPLWVAGLQLTTTFGHVMKGLSTALLPQAYGAALNFWAYPIIIILAIGTWRSHRRAQQTLESTINSV